MRTAMAWLAFIAGSVLLLTSLVLAVGTTPSARQACPLQAHQDALAGLLADLRTESLSAEALEALETELEYLRHAVCASGGTCAYKVHARIRDD